MSILASLALQYQQPVCKLCQFLILSDMKRHTIEMNKPAEAYRNHEKVKAG